MELDFQCPRAWMAVWLMLEMRRAVVRAEAVGFDAFRRNVGDVVDGCGSAAEFCSDVPGGDIVGPASGVKVAIQGRVRGGVEGA